MVLTVFAHTKYMQIWLIQSTIHLNKSPKIYFATFLFLLGRDTIPTHTSFLNVFVRTKYMYYRKNKRSKTVLNLKVITMYCN